MPPEEGGCLGVVQAVVILVDGQRAAVQLLRLADVPRLAQQRGQVVQAQRDLQARHSLTLDAPRAEQACMSSGSGKPQAVGGGDLCRAWQGSSPPPVRPGT